jgi:hypothetical protein
MPSPKQAGPAQPRRDAGASERRQNEESQHNKAERDAAPGRRLKGQPGDGERTPGAGALPSRQPGNDVDPGTG